MATKYEIVTKLRKLRNMLRNSFLLHLVAALLISSYFLLLTSPALVLAQSNQLELLTIKVDCDPALPPTSGGCNFGHFIYLIGEIIKLLMTKVVIPLAVLMMIWAGYVIMTAGGNESKYERGKTIMTTAIVGVIIALLAPLIIDFLRKLFWE